MKRLPKRLALPLLLAAAAPGALACEGLQVEQAWIREAPPGAGALGAYAVLHNRGSRPLVVEGGRSADFGAIELHRTLEEDGLMRMMRSQKIALAPGESARLEPGGYHLMLFRPARALAQGDVARIELLCSGAAPGLAADFTVRRTP